MERSPVVLLARRVYLADNAIQAATAAPKGSRAETGAPEEVVPARTPSTSESWSCWSVVSVSPTKNRTVSLMFCWTAAIPKTNGEAV